MTRDRFASGNSFLKLRLLERKNTHFYQRNIVLQKGSKYEVSFNAKGCRERLPFVTVTLMDHSGANTVLFRSPFKLNTTWTPYVYTFDLSKSSPANTQDVRLMFRFEDFLVGDRVDMDGIYIKNLSGTTPPPPPTAVCGNGVKEGTEQCDTGTNNGVCPKTCSSTCTLNTCTQPPVCGNGIVEGTEQCDAGSQNGACPLNCSKSCLVNTCDTNPPGDGKLYYLSPTGNDSANGSSATPWKTFTKANNSLKAGDTLILKDGVYPGYVEIKTSGTTWKAQNQYKAIIDGGFSPTLVAGSWDKITAARKAKCVGDGWEALLSMKNVSNVTMDGLFLRNSCGRGLLVTTGDGGRSQNVVFKNSMIDWTYKAAVMTMPDKSESAFPSQLQNFQFINNVMTRNSFDDEYNVRTGTGKYAINASTVFGGTNIKIIGNLIAWGKGEISFEGVNGFLYENNKVVGNKISFYMNLATDGVARNNIFYAPEEPLNPNKHMGYLAKAVGGHWKGIVFRNEAGRTTKYGTENQNNNIAIYNNLILNSLFSIDCYNQHYPSDTTQIYIGHNTFVVSATQDSLLRIGCGADPLASRDAVLTGVFENNIIDRRKNPSLGFAAGLSNNDKFVFRNNIWPVGASSSVRGSGDILTNDAGLVNSLARLQIAQPEIGAASVDINALRNAVDINNYRLKSGSTAINKGSTAGEVSSTKIPTEARTKDFGSASRVGVPDIGAFESK
jgi:hypothetical protein